jgi:hypothetical protein
MNKTSGKGPQVRRSDSRGTMELYLGPWKNGAREGAQTHTGQKDNCTSVRVRVLGRCKPRKYFLNRPPYLPVHSPSVAFLSTMSFQRSKGKAASNPIVSSAVLAMSVPSDGS